MPLRLRIRASGSHRARLTAGFWAHGERGALAAASCAGPGPSRAARSGAPSLRRGTLACQLPAVTAVQPSTRNADVSDHSPVVFRNGGLRATAHRNHGARRVMTIMRRSTASPHPTRGVHFHTALLMGVLAMVATPALSAEIAAHGVSRTAASNQLDRQPSGQEQRTADYWRGRYCTTTNCKSPRPGGLAEVVSFGLAAFGGAWLSRRRTG